LNEQLIESADALERLIKGSIKSEHECRIFLPHIAEELCDERPNSLLRIGGIEEPTRFGRSDYIVSAEVPRPGASLRCAFVWELKAPQLSLYEQDDNIRRFRPTKDLVKAETQLIHYVAEQQESTSFKEYYKLTPKSPVVAAGIIIGSDDRLIRTNNVGGSDFDEVAAALHSSYLREHYFYGKTGIRVRTWDWVVRGIRSRAEGRRIDLSGTVLSDLGRSQRRILSKWMWSPRAS
jgi:hypothetical protein